MDTIPLQVLPGEGSCSLCQSAGQSRLHLPHRRPRDDREERPQHALQVPDGLLLALPLLGPGEHGLRRLSVQENHAEQGENETLPHSSCGCCSIMYTRRHDKDIFHQLWPE